MPICHHLTERQESLLLTVWTQVVLTFARDRSTPFWRPFVVEITVESRPNEEIERRRWRVWGRSCKMNRLLLLLAVAASTLACPEFCKCREKVVDCSAKSLSKLPKSLPTEATTLLLTGNNINGLRKEDLRPLRKLEILIVRNNNIQYIEEGILDELPKLRRLHLARNKLRKLPRLATKPAPLISLELRHNNLIHLNSQAFSNCPHLMQLDLANNLLPSIPTKIFKNNMQLMELHLHRNPWNCDCRMIELKGYFAMQKNSSESACFTPPDLKKSLVHEVENSMLRCTQPIVEEESSGITLKCPTETDQGDEIVWIEGNEELETNETVVRIRPDMLRLTPDSLVSEISCTVDRLSRTIGYREQRQIRVHHGKAPQFTFKQKATSAREGDPLELTCEASGEPQPKMACYTCLASNIHGKVEHSVKVGLTSSEPPVIFDAPMSTTMEIGQQITFRCKARGVPLPEISWLFEGTRIPRRNTRYTISEDNIELTVEKLTRHDAGAYTCHAQNSVGSASAMARLNISNQVINKIDDFLNDTTVVQIAEQARINVDKALQTTKEEKAKTKMNDPNNLRSLFKFAATLGKVDLGKAREIYEESLRLIQEHIENGLEFSASGITPNVSYEAVLPVSFVQTLMEKSGCQTGQFVESCDDICYHSKYRSYDGQCNNFEHPLWGVSEMAFLRLLPPRYENGFNTPVGWEKGRLYNGFPLPNARKISRKLIGTDEITPHTHLSAMLMQWGQFIDHDLTLTAPALTRHSYREGAFCNRTCENLDPCFNIQLEPDDPKLLVAKNQKYPCLEFERNGAACGSGETSPIFQRVTYRDQLNVLTSYLDASAIYGNTEEQALELRDLYSDHGILRFDIVSEAQKPYLPFEKESEMDCRRNYSEENPIRCFLAGDLRANEQLGLTSMHTIFLREHNRIASRLLELNSNWDGETIYQAAMMQHITYNDWLPKLIGRPTFNEIIGPYKGYNPDVNPTIANEFATAALRFAHTMINPQLFRFDKNFEPIKEGNLPLHKAFFAPERLLSEGGIDPLLRGLFAAPIKNPRPDQILNKELTERLFSRYHEVALDLAAFNIQRGRDHGLPAWTEYRKFCNLSAPQTWEDMTPIVKNESVIAKLKELYGSPANIDLWVGGVTEKRTPEAMMGPTLACIIADQFKRLRDGDRFWYENEGMFTKLQLRQIKKASLSKIVCTNGDDIDRIQRDIFIYHGNSTTFYEPCGSLPEVNLNMWAACCDSTCHSSLSSASVSKAKKRKRHTPKVKVCDLANGEVKKQGETWMDHDDPCAECTCKESEVWCRVNHDCRRKNFPEV
ncbi:unnamed protein product [Caenorhabditis auriculariae]|uniref:Ig-like domain-containing protein n=1 Tax=Caenorhabditis auriculariae TaxID=2777116 RepID=A0A8S1HC06_9PELO|nr:unnamed protein product [Caenorhabditis auriculariae]